MKKNKIILLIVIMLIIISINIIYLIMLLKTDNMLDSEYEYTEENLKEQKISRVRNNNLFYTIENCLQKYETYLTLNYEKQLYEFNMPSIASVYKISNEEKKNKCVNEFIR